jgi:hypothetical protein
MELDKELIDRASGPAERLAAETTLRVPHPNLPLVRAGFLTLTLSLFLSLIC